MMKKKTKLLAIAVFILLGICFWQVTTTPLPCKYLGWLSRWPGQAKALSLDCGCCPNCEPSCLFIMPPYCTVSQCLQSCGGDDDDDDDDTPPPPPDQVEAGQGRFGVFDPQTPDITVDFPPGAVDVPVEVRAAYTDLPPGVAPPAGNVVGAPFSFGAWIRGEGKTVDKFNESVVINVRCENKPVHQLSGSTSAESSPPPEVAKGRDERPQEEKKEPEPDSSSEVAPTPMIMPTLLLVWKPQLVGSPWLVGSDFVHQVGGPPTSSGLQYSQVGWHPGFQTETTLTPTPTLTSIPSSMPQVAQTSSPQPSSSSLENQAGHPQLSMYDPNTQAWIKLCSRFDPYDNTVSGAIIFPTALKVRGNALLAVTIDNTPALEQSVDEFGNTTLSLPGSNFSFDILAGTVEVGTHFEVTPLLNAPNSTSFKLLPTPVDIKACQADYSTARKVRQITQFTKPIEVMFYYDANTLARAGSKNNLTIVSFQNRQWADLEEFGSRVVRGDNTIAVDSSNLGTFSMAVR